VDAVRQTVSGLDGRHSAGDPDHLFAAGRAADLALAVPGPPELAACVVAAKAIVSDAPDVAPGEMLKTPVFWLLFAMMTMMSTGGLMVISQFAPFMRSFGIADLTIFGMAALPFALTLDRITNGLTRPFFGWVSDRIGRENTMLVAFSLEAAAVLLMLSTRGDALLFALMSGVVFFGWGEIFSLFPSTLTDTFGAKDATTKYGFLYMAQGIGSVLGGPVAATLHDAAGTWIPVFITIIVMDALTAALAFFVLKPMRAAYLARRGGF
jgi:OFA family oxalate/formate antiporter-like MFS transporter